MRCKSELSNQAVSKRTTHQQTHPFVTVNFEIHSSEKVKRISNLACLVYRMLCLHAMEIQTDISINHQPIASERVISRMD